MQIRNSLPAEIITIGDEILIGQIVDTNSAWIGQRLNEIGVWVDRITSISDRREAILDALSEAGSRASLVLVTGGLGPTKDDITKQTICEFFDDHLVRDQRVYEHVTALLARKGIGMNPLNQKQADVLSKAGVVFNSCGTAPGMRLEKDGIVYYFMPGVPFETYQMMNDFILEEIRERFDLQHILHRVVYTQGLGESLLAERLDDFEKNIPSHISLAYLPEAGMVKLRLTAMGSNREILQADIEEQVSRIKSLVCEYIVSDSQKKPELAIKEYFADKGLTLSTAESCTGGYIASRLTSVPGASSYFKGGVISYSNEIKMQMLGISEETLMNFGAVSSQVAGEMAAGARKRLNTDYAVSVTGIAGPDGGTPDKPVGTVWMGLASPQGVITKCFHFGENRERNIQHTAMAVMAEILRHIQAVS